MKRQQIEEKYKWNLQSLYTDMKEWEKEFTSVKEQIKTIASFKGKLNQASQLKDCLLLDEKISLKTEQLYVYAALQKDQDTSNNESQRLLEKISNLSVEIGEASSYIVPEILELEEDALENMYKEEKDLEHYKKMISLIQRKKQHFLTQESEALLAKVSDVMGVGSEVFGMFNNADITFPEMELPNGEKVALTKSSYSTFMEHEDRSIRQQAYEKLYATYLSYKNTIATTLYSDIKETVLFSKIRNYPSALEKSLFSDNVPKEVYFNLLETTKKFLPSLQRYMDVRKNKLGVDELRMWDMYVSLLEDYKENIPYEEAYEKMKKGLSVLGEDYVALLEKAKENRWIDVYENEGKRGGAYAWGSYGVHPYVLLNHRDDLNSLFTLAHEMGHALHSYYSDEANPYLYAQYTIFVAEVASTVNEVLLMHYLLEQAEKDKNDNMKRYLMNYFLEQFRTTLFRQVMFAEFEHLTHAEVENGNPLTAEDFTRIYKGVHEDYYGDKVVHDEEIAHEWMRIPHFYTPFYVYKYATGFSAAIAIAKAILTEGEPVVTKYKEFLRSGGTDFPIELLKIAGVDLSTTKPVEDALQYFDELVSEFETLMK